MEGEGMNQILLYVAFKKLFYVFYYQNFRFYQKAKFVLRNLKMQTVNLWVAFLNTASLAVYV